MTARSPQHAPRYALYRDAISVADTITSITKKQCINMEGHDKALIQVIPGAAANPTVAVYWWSDEAGRILQDNPAITKAGVGAGVPYEFSVDCCGRQMFVAVTTIADDPCKIAVAGYGIEDRG